MTGLVSLPSSLLHQVGQNLTAREIGNFRAMAQFVNAAIEEHHTQYQKIVERLMYSEGLDLIETLSPRISNWIAHEIASPQLHWIVGQMQLATNPQFAQAFQAALTPQEHELFAKLPSIPPTEKTLVLDNIEDQLLHSSNEQPGDPVLLNLQHCDSICCLELTYNGDRPLKIIGIPNVRNLILNGAGAAEIIFEFPKLEELTIQDCSLELEQKRVALEDCPKLNTLRINNSVGPYAALWIPGHPSLRNLIVKECVSQVTAAYLPGLERINFIQVAHMREGDWNRPYLMSNLRELIISNFFFPPRVAIPTLERCVIIQAPSREIDLSQCHRLREVVVAACNNLVHLGLPRNIPLRRFTALQVPKLVPPYINHSHLEHLHTTFSNWQRRQFRYPLLGDCFRADILVRYEKIAEIVMIAVFSLLGMAILKLICGNWSIKQIILLTLAGPCCWVLSSLAANDTAQAYFMAVYGTTLIGAGILVVKYYQLCRIFLIWIAATLAIREWSQFCQDMRRVRAGGH